jgi:hypothetical protein
LVKEEADLHADSRSEEEDLLGSGMLACVEKKRDNGPMLRKPCNDFRVAPSGKDMLHRVALRDEVDQVEGAGHA